MRKIYIFILTIIMVLFCTYNVNAKDTLYSINKYTEENLSFIESSYNKNNKEDGYIVAGEYLKEEDKKEGNSENDYHAIVVKYNKEGKKIWEFSSKEIVKNNIDYLTYAYNEEGKIDGYLIVINKTVKVEEESEETRKVCLFLKINLNGKLEWEKEITIENYHIINKILISYNDASEFDGYILTASISTNDTTSATLIRLDKDFNIIWKKDQLAEEGKSITYTDMINIYEDNKIIGYAAIEASKENEKTISKLVKFDKDGNKEIITEALEEYESFNLAEANNGFILYGLTSNVKVAAGDYSYYLINFDSSNNEVWESIGDIGISTDEKIRLVPVKDKDKINKYLFLYQNAKDSSKEVIELDLDGLFKKKIKKISNEYYHIKDFISTKEVLYFVGNITCPEEDNCDYDTHSLFLISDEDKVIEVEDKTANNISIIAIAIIFLIVIIVFYKKKKRN